MQENINKPECYVYKITNSANGRSYIGISNNPQLRFRHHGYKDGLLARAMRLHGKENFQLSIIYEGSRDACKLEEVELIRLHRTLVTENGYNIDKGGSMPPHRSGEQHYNFGKRLSAETIAKIKTARAKQVFTAETREKMSRSRMGCNNPRAKGRLH